MLPDFEKNLLFFLALLASLPNFNDDVDSLTGDNFVINISGGDIFFSCFFLFQAVLRTQRALVDYRNFFTHSVQLNFVDTNVIETRLIAYGPLYVKR